MKSQPYFYSAMDAFEKPFKELQENNQKMSLRLQARSNTNLKERSILERGYNFDDKA